MKVSNSFVRGYAAPVLQKGFSLVELLFVVAVIGILGALATPFVRELIIEGRVDSTAKDVINIANTMRASASAGGGNTPYATLGTAAAATAVLANSSRGKALALTVTGAGATATSQHPLGATGSQVTAAVAANPTAGDSFDMVLPTVNKAACPQLANAVARSTEAIDINGTVVKAVGGAYNGNAAQNACLAGDNNTFTFTFR